jgi:RNA polymerase sigma-70 factor (ECF subfamily)
MSGREMSGSPEQPVLYCVVPADLAAQLHDLLLRHFRFDPRVLVVVERRGDERRRPSERRLAASGGDGPDRRLVRNLSGRRVGERRAMLVPVPALELPRKARPFAGRIAFIERLEPSGQHAEDLDTARLVMSIQSGDVGGFSVLYQRYFGRVYGYLRVALDDPIEAEDAAQQVFVKVFEALPRYERRGLPFRGWLFTIVRNHLRNELLRRARTSLLEPEAFRLEESGSDDDEVGAQLRALSWISDAELHLFIERLPLAQRQVLFLRYALGLSHEETAAALGRSAVDVRQLQWRALGFLRARLVAVGGGAARRARPPMVRRRGMATVLRGRRFALRP